MSHPELLVFRHAKSAWDTAAPTDYERPLARRGLRDAPRMGRWLADEDLDPDAVVSSPATRAEQTVRLALDELDQPAHVELEPRLYHAGVGTILEVLAEVPAGAERVLLVGHNPGLDEFVEYLSSRPAPLTANGKLMVTAAIAHFALDRPLDRIGRGTGTLLRIARPKELA